jgi:RNA polymerase sigma-70 factor, ECF subfamily
MPLYKGMDHAAFQKLLKKHQDDVFSHAYYFLRNREDAEDVAQEVFVKLWKYGSAVDEAKAGAWLMRVTHNQCIDCHRRRSKVRNAAGAGRDGSPANRIADENSADPETEFELTQKQQALLSAVQNLPETPRSLLLLHYFQDLSLESIGEIMGMSTGSVKVAIHRGRKRLKEVLAGQNPGSRARTGKPSTMGNEP